MPTNTKQQLCIKPTGFLVNIYNILYSASLDTNIYIYIIFMLISEEADGDSSSEEDQEMVDICNEQYTQDDVSVQNDIDTEAPQQTPEEAPEETPEQSGAPADDHIDIPLTEEEITILTSGEEEGGTQ